MCIHMQAHDTATHAMNDAIRCRDHSLRNKIRTNRNAYLGRNSINKGFKNGLLSGCVVLKGVKGLCQASQAVISQQHH